MDRQAPLFMVFCGDHRRIRRVAELRDRPFPNDTLDMFMNAAVDAGLVLQSFITAAEALGLGCCPISVVRNHVEKLGGLLELPPGVFPVAGLCVGYPRQPGWISMRLPPAVTVHTDRYDDRDLPAQLEAYDRPPRGPPRHPAREPALRRPLRLHRAVRLVGGQGAPVLGARAPQLRPLHPRPRLRAGLRRPAPALTSAAPTGTSSSSSKPCGAIAPRHLLFEPVELMAKLAA